MFVMQQRLSKGCGTRLEQYVAVSNLANITIG
jgi:hypothetical protein